MVAIITNNRTKENRVISLQGQITLEQVADRFLKYIACNYPKAYKLVHNRENHISIMAGHITKCVFDIRAVEELKDYDDSFLY